MSVQEFVPFASVVVYSSCQPTAGAGQETTTVALEPDLANGTLPG